MYIVKLRREGRIVFCRMCDSKMEAQYVAAQVAAELGSNNVRKYIYKIG